MSRMLVGEAYKKARSSFDFAAPETKDYHLAKWTETVMALEGNTQAPEVVKARLEELWASAHPAPYTFRRVFAGSTQTWWAVTRRADGMDVALVTKFKNTNEEWFPFQVKFYSRPYSPRSLEVRDLEDGVRSFYVYKRKDGVFFVTPDWKDHVALLVESEDVLDIVFQAALKD